MLVERIICIFCSDTNYKKGISKKKKATPKTVINEPITSFIVIFSLKRKIAGGIIKIGTMDIIVEAIPVVVCCTESKEK